MKKKIGVEYWLSKTVEERLAHVEKLRRKAFPELNDPNYRMDKTVFRIIKNGIVIKENMPKK